MAVLAKVLLLTVVVSVLVSTARACYGWPYQRARFDTLCDREPDRLLCEKLKLGPVHGSGEKNGADDKGKGNEPDETPDFIKKDCN